jgi:hypothetical protein
MMKTNHKVSEIIELVIKGAEYETHADKDRFDLVRRIFLNHSIEHECTADGFDISI